MAIAKQITFEGTTYNLDSVHRVAAELAAQSDNELTGASTVSGNSGDYTLTNVFGGTYDVVARHPYFLNAMAEDVGITGDTTGVDITLKAGDVDADNDVDFYDYYGIFYNYGQSGAPWAPLM